MVRGRNYFSAMIVPLFRVAVEQQHAKNNFILSVLKMLLEISGNHLSSSRFRHRMFTFINVNKPGKIPVLIASYE